MRWRATCATQTLGQVGQCVRLTICTSAVGEVVKGLRNGWGLVVLGVGVEEDWKRGRVRLCTLPFLFRGIEVTYSCDAARSTESSLTGVCCAVSGRRLTLTLRARQWAGGSSDAMQGT